MTAAQAAIYTFNERALIPSEHYDWDSLHSRLFRYVLAEGYYNNIAYRDIATYSKRLKLNRELYKHTRGVYNPVYRLVEAYVAKVYGGALDFEDMSGGAIPIRMASDELLTALRQVWLWSNWRLQKSVYVRTGAQLGDVALKIVDEPDKGRVRIEVLHPGKIKAVTLDTVGNVKAAIMEYKRYDQEAAKWYRYTETIEKVDALRVHFATYRDDKPFAFVADTTGKPMAEWDVPYGFVPLVLIQHKDVGMQWGANAFHGQMGKIDEMNDGASLLNDQVRKAINLMWYFAGVQGKDELKASTDNKGDGKDKDKLPAIYGPKDSVPTPMIANLDISAAGGNIDRMLAELERDMPELAMHRLREGGNLTAPGVRSAYNDAIDRFVEAQGNYDDGLIRAQKMAVSIGGFRRYDGFEPFGLQSYDRGDLEHYIADRPVVDDALSVSEKVTALQAAQAPIWLILQELGYDNETVANVLKWDALQKQVQSETALAQPGAPAQITAGGTPAPINQENAPPASEEPVMNEERFVKLASIWEQIGISAALGITEP